MFSSLWEKRIYQTNYSKIKFFVFCVILRVLTLLGRMLNLVGEAFLCLPGILGKELCFPEPEIHLLNDSIGLDDF